MSDTHDLTPNLIKSWTEYLGKGVSTPNVKSDLVFRRKVRHTVEFLRDDETILEERFVRSNFPAYQQEMQEIEDHRGQQHWIPGRRDWNAVEITFYNLVEQTDPVWPVLAEQYEGMDPNNETPLKKFDCVMRKYSGDGEKIGEMTLNNCIASSVCFGDYYPYEETTIDLTLKYDDTSVTYLD